MKKLRDELYNISKDIEYAEMHSDKSSRLRMMAISRLRMAVNDIDAANAHLIKYGKGEE